MAWLDKAQILLTLATTAVASYVGVEQFRLTRQVETLKVDLARQTEVRLDREQQRRFNFDVFGVVIDSLKDDQPELQRALVAYFQALEESEFRSSMLTLFRAKATDRIAAKEAGATLGREVEMTVAQVVESDPSAQVRIDPEGALSPDLEAPGDRTDDEPSPGDRKLGYGVVTDGNRGGWDFDLFVCEASFAADPPVVVAAAERTLEVLGAFDPRHGRVRVRQLQEAVRLEGGGLMRPGLFMIVDPVDAERKYAADLAGRLAGAGLAFEQRPNDSAPSPWYLSLFVCPA